MLLKYEQGQHGDAVYEEYAKALDGLIAAYHAPWGHDEFHMPTQDTTALTQVVPYAHTL